MAREALLVFGIALLALVAMGVVLWLAFRPAVARGGLRLELLCPRDQAPAQVRIGRHPITGALAVLWCDRFDGPVTCDRGCFSNERAGRVLD